jgi:MoxR-like ATPase
VSQESPSARLAQVLQEVRTVIVGQDRVLERVMVCLLARGHCLIEGVPGIAKTLTVRTLAEAVGGSFARLQFTPDLVPADVVGTRIYRSSSESFDIELGPVFANFVLADEVNRAPAKVQSALLEAMAEQQVSIAGQTFPLPAPFIVLATQNPIESEGVYPLPEAQRDRFLMKVLVDYPSALEEQEIVRRMGSRPPRASQVLSAEELGGLQDTASQVTVSQALVEYVVRLTLVSRTPLEHGLQDVGRWVAYGASPRASLGLVAAARALALLRGRDHVRPEDVVDLVPDVLRHRLVLSYDALADGVPIEHVIGRIMQTAPPPHLPEPIPAAPSSPDGFHRDAPMPAQAQGGPASAG